MSRSPEDEQKRQREWQGIREADRQRSRQGGAHDGGGWMALGLILGLVGAYGWVRLHADSVVCSSALVNAVAGKTCTEVTGLYYLSIGAVIIGAILFVLGLVRYTKSGGS